MLKKLLNQAMLELTIKAQGPLLIKSGIEGGADPSVPDMQFVRSSGQVYIPGSSLKGVFRSYAEKIARTVNPDARRDWCCDPFDDDHQSITCSCSRHTQIVADRIIRDEKRRLTSAEIYKRRDCTCRICQIFGSTSIASRIKFNDAYPSEGQIPATETRTSVAIDRILGSVARGPFDFEVVTTATFTTSFYLRNFELWQLGLLALVLRDFEEGLVPIGFGKSRGLGEVTAQVTAFEVRYPSALQQLNHAMLLDGRSLGDVRSILYGIGALTTEDERESYGLSANDRVNIGTERTLSGADLGVRVSLDEAARHEVFRQCVNIRWREVINRDRNRAQGTT